MVDSFGFVTARMIKPAMLLLQAEKQAQPGQQIVADRCGRSHMRAIILVVASLIFGHHRSETFSDLRPSLKDRIQVDPMDFIDQRMQRCGDRGAAGLTCQQ